VPGLLPLSPRRHAAGGETPPRYPRATIPPPFCRRRYNAECALCRVCHVEIRRPVLLATRATSARIYRPVTVQFIPQKFSSPAEKPHGVARSPQCPRFRMKKGWLRDAFEPKFTTE